MNLLLGRLVWFVRLPNVADEFIDEICLGLTNPWGQYEELSLPKELV